MEVKRMSPFQSSYTDDFKPDKKEYPEELANQQPIHNVTNSLTQKELINIEQEYLDYYASLMNSLRTGNQNDTTVSEILKAQSELLKIKRSLSIGQYVDFLA